jgi:hypothetical protein
MAQFPSVPPARNIDQARRHIRIAERAQGMFTAIRDGGQGYVAYANTLTGIWSVRNPEGTHYAVTLGATPTCSCPDFQAHGDLCKHTYGLQLQLDHEAEEEQCRCYEATRAAAGVHESLLPNSYGG